MGEQVVEITDRNFEQEVARGTLPAIVDFWAAWCQPCRAMAPVVEEVAKSYAGRVKVGKVNVDENAAIAARFRVMAIPTLVFFKEGREVDRITGAVPRADLTRRLDALLSG